MTTLTSDRLVLRRWRPDDLPAFAAINGDPHTMRFFATTLDRAGSDALAARIEAHFDEHGFGFWAVEVRGVAPFVGMVGLARPNMAAHFTPCVEIGWRLAPAFWGRGYATEAARRALDFGFAALHLPEIVAFTSEHNTPSRAVMERLGMTRDPADDFDHPNLAAGHALRRHVLYRLAAPA